MASMLRTLQSSGEKRTHKKVASLSSLVPQEPVPSTQVQADEAAWQAQQRELEWVSADMLGEKHEETF